MEISFWKNKFEKIKEKKVRTLEEIDQINEITVYC